MLCDFHRRKIFWHQEMMVGNHEKLRGSFEINIEIHFRVDYNFMETKRRL